MNIRFHFRQPADVERRRDYRGRSLAEANAEIKKLRSWLEALTEQLEYVIGKEAEDGNKINERR